jgi:nitrogen regulatory protein P-II 2
VDAFVVTIIAPEGQEDALERSLVEVGASGYTAWKARGFGEHGARPTQWAGHNVRIDVLVDEDTRLRVLAMLEAKHPRANGVFAYVTPAQVPDAR